VDADAGAAPAPKTTVSPEPGGVLPPDVDQFPEVDQF
jgi:hypothetical protein